MKFFQRIVIDWTSEHLSIWSDGTMLLSSSHEEQFTLFLETRQKLWRRGRRRVTFEDLYARGMIQDSALFSSYLRFLLARSQGLSLLIGKLSAVILVPTGVPALAKELWATAADRAGISEVLICGRAIAAAVGAGFSFPLPRFVLVLHLGSDASELTGLSFDASEFSLPLSFSGEKIQEELAARGTSGDGEEVQKELALEAIARIEMQLSALSPESLGVVTEQGILMSGELATPALEKLFSSELHLPIYALEDQVEMRLKGAATIASILARY